LDDNKMSEPNDTPAGPLQAEAQHGATPNSAPRDEKAYEAGSTAPEPTSTSNIHNNETEEHLSSSTSSGTAAHTTLNNDENAATEEKEPEKPEAKRTSLETFVIMASLCASVFLAALDVTIVTTAVPTIAEHFHSSAGYTWIGSAYLLANAASTPSWGKISDIWGRKPIILCAATVFFVGSALAGASVSIGMLIAARAIQGMGGGGLIILANICIADLFSQRERGKYYGIIGMVWAFASAVGPILGGVFTEKASWRWCFYVNLPITGTAFVVLFFYLHLDNPRTPVWAGLKAVDWTGSLAIVGGTLMLLLGLEFGGVTYPWSSAMVVCLIVFGILVAGLFVLNEWKFAKYPVMPLRLFNNRPNLASLGACFCHGFVFIAGSYYLPLYFQAVLGATPLLSGVYLLPFALALSFTSGATGAWIKKTGQYLPPIIFGMVLLTLGFGLLIDLPTTTKDANGKNIKSAWAKIILYQIVAGIGVGPNFQSPLIALQTGVKPRDIATATATFGFTRNISTSISVVIGGVVFQNQMQKKLPNLLAVLGSKVAMQLSGGSAGANIGIVQSLTEKQKAVARLAYYDSLRIMWCMYVAFAALGLAVSFLIVQRKLEKEHQLTKTGLKEEEANRVEAKESKNTGEKRAVKGDDSV
jgi:EmrB/QacA subfamily drug resistance transporter